MNGIKYLILIIILLNPAFGYSQRVGTDKELDLKETQKLAELSLQEGKFEKALSLYQKLLNANPKNPLLNFLVGYCYQNTDFGLEQSIDYLKNAVEYPAAKPEEQVPIEAYYYLGKAYQKNYQFNEAIMVLTDFLENLKKNTADYMSPKANEMLRYAQNGLMLSQTKPNLKIENLIEINSKYSDRNQLFDSKSDAIIFTSRRENPMVRKKLDDGQFDENIYISKKAEDTWDQPYGISNTINTSEHESTCWLSENGDQLLFSRFDKNGGSLYLTIKKENGEWGVPEKINSPVNNGSATTFGSFSPDGKFLYFSSNRKGGLGGTDIYMVEYFGNNQWGPAKNLGNKINTELNEESPNVNENGILFFSSEGHVSIGGFDVFLSAPDKDGNWSNPVNMGIPVNSTSNDFYYKPAKDGQTAYLSSDRSESKGKSDVFIVDYTDSLFIPSAIVAGSIKYPDGFDANDKVEIKILNFTDNRPLFSLKPNGTGIYYFYLSSDATYSMEFLYQNKPFYYAKLNLAKSYSIAVDQIILIKDISLNPENIESSGNADKDTYVSICKASERVKQAYFKKLKQNKQEISELGDVENEINNDSNNTDSIYSIRIAVSENELPLNSFDGLTDVKQLQTKNGQFIYYIGEFIYEWEAQVKLKKIQENYPDAAVFINRKIQ